jgi:hypothetical protein
MYLILVPSEDSILSGKRRNPMTYQSYFTDEMDSVSKCLKDNPCTKVFKLNSLTEIKEIKTTHEEVTAEMAND